MRCWIMEEEMLRWGMLKKRMWLVLVSLVRCFVMLMWWMFLRLVTLSVVSDRMVLGLC